MADRIFEYNGHVFPTFDAGAFGTGYHPCTQCGSVYDRGWMEKSRCSAEVKKPTEPVAPVTVDPWEVLRTALGWIESPSSAPPYDHREGLTYRCHDCGDPGCVTSPLQTLLRTALAAEPPARPVQDANQRLRDAALDFGKAHVERDTEKMMAASRAFERALLVRDAALTGAKHPGDAADHDRWVARIKTLEERAERVVAILRGEPEPEP